MTMPSLYGLSPNCHLPISSTKLYDKSSCCRMVIIQDAGIRKKQPIFDSAVSYNKNFSIMQQKLNKKIHHSINELSLFMFGCYGIPISENNMTTKMHYLPSLVNMPASVLITRLFSLDSSFTLKPHKLSDSTSDWDPHPILQTDELPLYENSSIRFSIGIIIPISPSIEAVRDEITENWFQISESLLKLQNLIAYKLKQINKSQMKNRKQSSQQTQTLGNSPTQNILSNNALKLSFPIYCLQSDVELYQELSSFFTQIISLVEIPRLFIDLKDSNQSLINWASTLSLWLELKDGKTHYHDTSEFTHDNASDNFNISNSHSSNIYTSSCGSLKFLASLLYILLPLRNDLFLSLEENNNIKSRLRVIIGTGNPIVSQKLIFILVGILGYEKFSSLYKHSQDLQKNDLNISKRDPEAISTPQQKTETETDGARRCILTRNNSLIIDVPSKENILKASSTPIPHSPSISTISANVQSQRIPVPSMSRTSSYASLQNLSSSYSKNIPSSIGSQISSNSWRNFGFLVDRWKNSVTPSPTTSQHSQQHSNSSKTETPSPNIVEYDEYPWMTPRKPNNNLLSSSPSPSFISIHTSSTQHTNRFTLTNNPVISTYKANDDYKIIRSANNLLGAKLNNVRDNIASEINSIMNESFQCSILNNDESIMEVDMKNDNNLNAITEIPLPMLAGYVSQYRPEFNMMSCPNKNIQENMFIDTMKNDLKDCQINQSRLYFIDLAMRKVNFFEMKCNPNTLLEKNQQRLYVSDSSHSHLVDESKTDSAPKLRNQLKSNLTKTMQTSYDLNQSTIFNSSKLLNNMNVPGIINSNVLEENVDTCDSILEQIASIINNFFFEMNTVPDRLNSVEHEEECCKNIRNLITKLLAITESQ